MTEARNAFQKRLLVALFKAHAPGQLILKGGGAMKVRSENARFTKDLDLDHDPKRGLDSLVRSIRKAIDRSFEVGYKKLEVSEPKQTETVARWKIRAAGPTGEEFQLTVEVSRRHEIEMADVETVLLQIKEPNFSARAYVAVYKSDKLAEMKLWALLDDNRVRSPDIYDLDLLISEGAAPVAEAIASMNSKYGDVSAQLIQKMQAMPWSLFERQTLSVIPDDLKARINEREYGSMQERILNEVMKWTARSSQNLAP